MNKRSIIFGLIIILLSMVCSYISTSFALAESNYPIHSKDVEYTDNSNLGVTQVQAAIDGTCSNIDNRLDSINSDYSQNFASVSCESGESCVIKTISGLDSSSIYLVTAWVRAQHSLSRVITAGISDDIGRELGVAQAAGSIDNNIYPRITVSTVTTGTTTIKISGSQNGGSTATLDARYSIIKLK